jgi:hypothetical protein
MKTIIRFLVLSILIGMGTCCYAKKYKHVYTGVVEKFQYYDFSTYIKYSTNKLEYFVDLEDEEDGEGVILQDEIDTIISEVIKEMQSMYTLQDWSINYPNVYSDFECRIYDKVTTEFSNVDFRIIKVRFYWSCSSNITVHKYED